MTRELECSKRQHQEEHGADGVIRPIVRCNHPSSQYYVKKVDDKICAECPLKILTSMRPVNYTEFRPTFRSFDQPKIYEDGTIEYPKTGWEPPKTPEGYRKGKDDWTFIPLFQICLDRVLVNTVAPCGCIKVHAMCDNEKSEHYEKQVDPDKCSACPVRRQ